MIMPARRALPAHSNLMFHVDQLLLDCKAMAAQIASLGKKAARLSYSLRHR